VDKRQDPEHLQIENQNLTLTIFIMHELVYLFITEPVWERRSPIQEAKVAADNKTIPAHQQWRTNGGGGVSFLASLSAMTFSCSFDHWTCSSWWPLAFSYKTPEASSAKIAWKQWIMILVTGICIVIAMEHNSHIDIVPHHNRRLGAKWEDEGGSSFEWRSALP
jgi:hypothetical protein